MDAKQRSLFIFTQGKGLKSVTISRGKLLTLLVGSGVLFVTLVFICFVFLSDLFYQSRITRLRKNNDRLVSSIYELENRLRLMESELQVINEKDKALRTYVDIPTIDQDVRKLGIGGMASTNTEDLDQLLPNQDISMADLMSDIDRLGRLIKLEKISYESIYNAFKHRSAEIMSTPAIRPINLGYITDGFGYRTHPFSHKRQMHYGVDIAAPTGTPIFATADGVISSVKRTPSYGRQIAIDHGFGYATFYAHLSKSHVKVNDVVKRGDMIGEVGCTGRSTGPHLHYEVRQFGVAVDPLDYFFTVYN